MLNDQLRQTKTNTSFLHVILFINYYLNCQTKLNFMQIRAKCLFIRLHISYRIMSITLSCRIKNIINKNYLYIILVQTRSHSPNFMQDNWILMLIEKKENNNVHIHLNHVRKYQLLYNICYGLNFVFLDKLNFNPRTLWCVNFVYVCFWWFYVGKHWKLEISKSWQRPSAL